MAHRIRIRFSKHSHMIFIGHLDLMRYFQKAIRRSGIDISYTAGFSPHQVMSFAQPLGVGVYSQGEYMDISMETMPGTQNIMDALNGVMVEGVDILDVIELPEDAVNSMASVAAAEYSVYFREDHVPDFDIGQGFEAFMAQEHINIIKETKKGSREVDLKEHIYRYGIFPGTQDPEGKNSITVSGIDKGCGCINMLLDASSGGNIKPGLVMEEFYRYMGREMGKFDIIVKREDMFADKGDEKEHIWQSLSKAGTR
ncbi:MAG: DUF2344 domain-containing protein [Lachnospiraceae bacterium]|nr:DUF2344 domain-containing protein [Lachnospiraceae bacterium]